MCNKEIDADEFVVNWGSCVLCLDAHYTEYLRDRPLSEDPEIPLDFNS